MADLYSRFYISTGEQSKMFTLRHQFEEIVSYPAADGETDQVLVMRDFYIQNLSIDAERAKETAKNLGYNVSLPKFSLEEIQKRTAEECAESKRIAEERFATTQKMKLDLEIKLLQELAFPFGYNQGMLLEKLVATKGIKWGVYWMQEGRNEGASATIKLLGSVLESLYPDDAKYEFMDKSGNGEYFGKVGVRQKLINVTCIEKFGYDGFYGWVSIVKFFTESGELLTYKGSADVDTFVGEELTISFGIKEHSEYEGVNQTVIQRIKVQ